MVVPALTLRLAVRRLLSKLSDIPTDNSPTMKGVLKSGVFTAGAVASPGKRKAWKRAFRE